MIVKIVRYIALISMLIVLVGCAPQIIQQPVATFVPSKGKRIELSDIVDIRLSTGYTRTLKADSNWSLVGNIPQGEIYKPENQVLTLEGSHIHEAYIVVNEGRLTGFYLPVEETFSPINSEKPLPIK